MTSLRAKVVHSQITACTGQLFWRVIKSWVATREWHGAEIYEDTPSVISSFLLHRIYTLASRPACTRFSNLSLSLSLHFVSSLFYVLLVEGSGSRARAKEMVYYTFQPRFIMKEKPWNRICRLLGLPPRNEYSLGKTSMRFNSAIGRVSNEKRFVFRSHRIPLCSWQKRFHVANWKTSDLSSLRRHKI